MTRPNSCVHLRQAIERYCEGTRDPLRLGRAMANVILGQMLPEGGGQSGAISRAGVPSSTEQPIGEPPVVKDNPAEGSDDDTFRVVLRTPEGGLLDTETVAHVDIDSDGQVTIKETPVVVTDLDDTSRAFGASVVCAIAQATTGTPDTVDIGFDSYLSIVDVLFPAMPYTEKQRLYKVYQDHVGAKQAKAEAERKRLAEGIVIDDNTDDEGMGTDADRGFGDKALAAYKDETLAQFLKLSAFANAAAGRNLQAFLGLLRERLDHVYARDVAGKVRLGTPLNAHDRAIEAARRIMNPRALLYVDTPENRERVKEIEKLDAILRNPSTTEDKRKKMKAKVEQLRVELYSSTTAPLREAEWRRVMNDLENGLNGLSFDVIIRELLNSTTPNGEPTCRLMAFLLGFLKGLTPAMRLRLMNLCANSATCTRTRVTRRTVVVDEEEIKLTDAEIQLAQQRAEAQGMDPSEVKTTETKTIWGSVLELDTVPSTQSSSNLTVLSESFMPLVRMSVDEVDRRHRQVLHNYEKVRDEGAFQTLSLEQNAKSSAKNAAVLEARQVLSTNMKVLAEILSPLFGGETTIIQMLTSPGFIDHLAEMSRYQLPVRKNTAVTFVNSTIIAAAQASSPKLAIRKRGSLELEFKDQWMLQPPLLRQILDIVTSIRTILNTSKDHERATLEDAVVRACLSAFSVGMSEDTPTTDHLTANVKPLWTWLTDVYVSSQPVTITNAELLPEREIKTTSSVAVSSRGVIPGVQRWMDLPITDKNSFAYIAKNYIFGSTGNRLRAMSDAEFLQDVLPYCRQTMTWPDTFHTPILAKNISRSYTPNEVSAACRERFERRAMSDDVGPVLSDGTTMLLGSRWYCPLFAGDHSSATLLQFPRFINNNRTTLMGVPLKWAVQRKDTVGTYKTISDHVSKIIGMEKIAKAPICSPLMYNDAPGVSLCGTRETPNGIEHGESRVHLIFNFSEEFLRAGGDAKKQEAMKGTVIGRGYGFEQSRLTAGDPLSHIIKAHILSASGNMLTFFKGLVSVVGGKDGMKFAKGMIERTIDDYLEEFRKNDPLADISTDTALDGDAYKVGHGRSAVAGVPTSEGTVSLFKYISDKLAKADIPAGGLSLDELNKILEDGQGKPGEFQWSDESGKVSRTTIVDLLGARNSDNTPASDPGIIVRVIQGQRGDETGYLIDFSYVDNALQSYTVANVSHTSEPENGRTPRNHVTDAITLASMLLQSGQLKGEVRKSVADILNQLSTWGIVAATTATDPSTITSLRNEAMSESLEAIMQKGEDPHGMNAEQQLAYDLFKRLTKLIGFPMNKIDSALVSGGAVFDASRGVVVDHTADPFLRLMHLGSRVYSKNEMQWRGVPRSLGLGQINMANDASRYGWHLDRKAFAKAYAVTLKKTPEELESLPARELCEELEKIFQRVHAADLEVEGVYRAGKAKEEECKAKMATAQALRDVLTSCFVDHNGQRISSLKCHFNQHERHLANPEKQHDEYRYAVCFDDLFIAGPGEERIFDRSAFFFGNAGYRFDPATCDHKVTGLDHMAADNDPVFLAGSTFGFPRTPSGNGSMWIQTMRAFAPVTTETAEDSAIVPGRDAYVAPDPQSMYILGCDNDGDKSQCYMLYGSAGYGVTSYVSLEDPWDSAPVRDQIFMFLDSPQLQREYLNDLVGKGVLTTGTLTPSDDKSQTTTYRINLNSRNFISNQFVRSLFDMSHWLPCSNGDTEKNFADTEFAHPTKPQPVNQGAMSRLIAVADPDVNFLAKSTLEDSDTASNVMTSSRGADTARGMAVALASILHYAQISGRFNKTLFRNWSEDDMESRLQAWIDFIYRIDGVSNATFDDIKEQICRRLGWTKGLMDTLIIDVLTHGKKTPTTDDEFVDALIKFTSSVSGIVETRNPLGTGFTYTQGDRTSRYYMLVTSSDSVDTEDEIKIVQKVHKFFRSEKEKKRDQQIKDIEGKAPEPPANVLRSSVEGFFGFREHYDARGFLRYVRGDLHGTKIDPRVVRFLDIFDTLVGENSGETTDAKREAARSVAYRELVSLVSKRRGVNAGCGYLYWLFTRGALKTKEGNVENEVTEFFKWFIGARALTKARYLANAANFTKADPSDAGRVSRQYETGVEFLRVMGDPTQNVNPEVQKVIDTVLYKMNAARELMYRAGALTTVPARSALSIEMRGEAIIRLAETIQASGAMSQDARNLVVALFAGDSVPVYKQKTVELNQQMLVYFLAALRTIPAAEPLMGGTDLLHCAPEKQWEMLEMLSREEGTLGLLRTISALFRVFYYLVSTSRDSKVAPAFFTLTGTVNSAWGAQSIRYDEDFGEDVKEDVYAGGYQLARITALFSGADSLGRQVSQRAIREVGGLGEFKTGVLDGHKRRDRLRVGGSVHEGGSNTVNMGVDTYVLSLSSITKLYEFAGGPHNAEEIVGIENPNVSKQVADDIVVVLELFKKYLPEGTTITPSTFIRQLLPIYATLTSRAMSPSNPLALMPEYYNTLSKEQAYLYSGVLEGHSSPTRAGFSVLDAASATNLSPVSQKRLNMLTKHSLEAEGRSLKFVPDISDVSAKKANDLVDTLTDLDETTRGGAKTDITAPVELKETWLKLRDEGDPREDPDDKNHIIDALSPAGVVKSLYQYTFEMAGPVQLRRQPDPVEDAIVELVAHWAIVQYIGGRRFVIRSKGGLNGSAAYRFGGKNGTAAAITVHVGADANAFNGTYVDMNSYTFAASFCEALKKAGFLNIDVEGFMNLTYDERRALVLRFTKASGKLAAMNFSLSKPSWSISAEGLRVLSGQIYVGDLTEGSLYHEYFHSMIGMFRTMGVFGDADVKAFVKRFGKARKGVDELFNEEAAAEAFREYVERLKGKKGETTQIIAGFSHGDAKSATFLFDMVINGYAVESKERAAELENALLIRDLIGDAEDPSAKAKRLVDLHVATQEQSEEYMRVEGEAADLAQANDKTYAGEADTKEKAFELADTKSAERYNKITEGYREQFRTRKDLMEGYTMPKNSVEANLSALLINELITIDHKLNVRVVQSIIDKLIDKRQSKIADGRTTLHRIAKGRGAEVQAQTAEDTIRLKVGVALKNDPMRMHTGLRGGDRPHERVLAVHGED